MRPAAFTILDFVFQVSVGGYQTVIHPFRDLKVFTQTPLSSISFTVQRNFYIGTSFGNEAIEVRSAWSATSFEYK